MNYHDLRDGKLDSKGKYLMTLLSPCRDVLLSAVR